MGAEYELKALGGPSQALLEFVNDNSSKSRLEILKTTQTGVLIRASGRPGSVTVKARAFGLSGYEGGGRFFGLEQPIDVPLMYSEVVLVFD